MDAIERVEVQIRTYITYHLGHAYGAFGYTDPNNFHNKFNHSSWIKKLESEVARSKDGFIEHYKRRYTGFPTLPIWMATETMSFGALYFCYNGMLNDDKKIIAKNYDVHYKRLQDWLNKLRYIRNVCAHHSRIWNKELAIKTESVRDLRWNAPLTPNKNRVFYILLVLRWLLRSSGGGNMWADRCAELIEPITHDARFRIAMGIPENWKEHPLWV